jgi:NADH-quinone oxidoreductase E subunit
MVISNKKNPSIDSFEFSVENRSAVKEILGKYPAGREQSAVMPLLHLAQDQHDNWVSKAAMDHIASILNIAPMKVYEVATFYSMYNKNPVGTNLIQVCKTTPCWLQGSDEVTKACKDYLGIEVGETTADGRFTLVEVECLGACVNAPVVQINKDLYEDLDSDSTKQVLEQFSKNQNPQTGPQNGRTSSSAYKEE